MDTLQLRLSLLRGDTASPMEMEAFGRPGRLRLNLRNNGVLSDRLANNFLGLIADGGLVPGARIPAERKIVSSNIISRVCVRTALDRLKADGLLESTQGSATRVVLKSDQLDILFRANRENLTDLGIFCTFLDEILVQLAVERVGMEKLVSCFKGLQKLFSQSIDEQISREYQLRLSLAKASGSKVLQNLILHFRRGFGGYFKAALNQAKHGDDGRKFDRLTASLQKHCSNNDKSKMLMAMQARSLALQTYSLETSFRAANVAKANPEEIILRQLKIEQPEKLSQVVAREISDMIAADQMRGIKTLFGERRLADMLGVSRVTVRSALEHLKNEGVVTSSERIFTRSRNRAGNASIAGHLAGNARVRVTEFRILCRVRRFLEVWAAKQAALQASPQDRDDLRYILAQLSRPIESSEWKVDFDLRLHLTIARAAGSALHLFVAEILRNMVENYFNYTLREPALGAPKDDLLLVQHQNIVSAIVAGDSLGAETAMAHHVGSFLDQYKTYGMGAPH